jgi:hypothetical protein
MEHAGTKTEHILMDNVKRLTEIEKNCIREHERYCNMAEQVKEIWVKLDKLDEIIRGMEKKWMVLWTVGVLSQMVVIPLIIKFIIK